MRLAIPFLALGVWCLQQLAHLPGPAALALSGVLAAMFVLAASRVSQRSLQLVLVVVAAFLAGFGWAGWRAEMRLAEHLPAEWEGRDVELLGVVAEMPQPFARGERFVFDVEEVLTSSAIVPGRVLLSWYAEAAEATQTGETRVRPGERWRMVVRLKRPHGNANPHVFDYEAWLLERDLRATGYVRPGNEARRLDDFVLRPGYLVERIRHDIRGRFLADLAGAEFGGILVALAVGDQRAIQGDFWNVFSRTGTTHLMSISGLHVTMVASLFGWLVGWLWRHSPRLMHRLAAQRAAVLAGMVAAAVYAALAGFSVPAQRTVYMLTVASLAMLSGRRTSPSSVMKLALLAVLVIDPWAVLSPGFWLSFGAVGLLFYVASGRVGDFRGWRARLAAWGAAQWAVTIGSLPLLLLFFQQFSLVSPLANALAIPVVSLLVTPLALLAVVVPLPGLLALDHWLLAQLMDVLTMLADMPVLERPAPPAAWLMLGVGGALWLLMPRGVPARWLGAVLMLPALLHVPPRPEAGRAWVEVLDVGQGLAVLVRTAGHALLYDAGPLYSAESDAGQRIVVPYLRAIGQSRLDVLMVTHRDSDHSGGAASVMAAMPVTRILSSVDDMTGERCQAGMAWEWDGVHFSLLHPPAAIAGDGRLKPNNRSCVLRVSADNGSMLLTSDIEAVDEQALLERDAGALRADVLLVPHHGSRTSSTPAFIEAVGAKDVIYPVGYRNRFGHPRPDIVARYGTVRAWRTDRDGAVRVDLGDELRISAWRQQRPRYWQGR